ncbi:MAG: hypothetical protein OR993_04345 [Candidatus Poseidoniales archaeon]|jgi:hypothetical protein|nr:hypothetical protein [Candidatus Poseidoniales archaeon]|tara:strand:+ start:387 stop:710 length:324 start_codon:yes stop_codon:yes gene_type:complete
MSSKAEDKVEVKVVVESKDTSSKVILIILILVLAGLMVAVIANGGPSALLKDRLLGEGNCGDGIDNDKGGQADEDDPDCYSNPSVWEGYDPKRVEANRDNDPPSGQP